MHRTISNCPEMLARLVELGADVHCFRLAENGPTILQKGARRPGWDHNVGLVVRNLVEQYGVDVNEERSHDQGWTTLEAACYVFPNDAKYGATTDIVEFLLGRGAIITPLCLHTAAAFGNEVLGNLLLSSGASIADLQKPTHIRTSYWEERDLKHCSDVAETAELNGHHELAEKLRGFIGSGRISAEVN
ncbi:hypothetical protein T440DRAFT_475610 [Plenodomus tracheiphilus IPT5]|uniref:Ankyrin n=1 Tax=Plenodomus tracheiphilus IPT5 TaxID=1408161 RepID=A0A6A7BMI5_9PLEO|nr:hypothetical protein T440DRAFT_475610 [Plenodomus tracheiphilus IPT5]